MALSNESIEYLDSMWDFTNAEQGDDLKLFWDRGYYGLVASRLIGAGAIEPVCKSSKQLLKEMNKYNFKKEDQDCKNALNESEYQLYVCPKCNSHYYTDHGVYFTSDDDYKTCECGGSTTKQHPKPKPTKTFLKYKKALTKKTLTKSEINGFRYALNGVKRVNIQDGGRDELLDIFYKNGPYKITKEHTDQGLKYLLNIAFKKNGELRETKDQPFGYHEAEILKNFDHFELVELYDAAQNQPYMRGDYYDYCAVWRVYAKDGSFFDYFNNGQWSKPIIY